MRYWDNYITKKAQNADRRSSMSVAEKNKIVKRNRNRLQRRSKVDDLLLLSSIIRFCHRVHKFDNSTPRKNSV